MGFGSVAEWFKALVLKTSEVQASVSSNLTASASPVFQPLKMRFGPLVVQLVEKDGNCLRCSCLSEISIHNAGVLVGEPSRSCKISSANA